MGIGQFVIGQRETASGCTKGVQVKYKGKISLLKEWEGLEQESPSLELF